MNKKLDIMNQRKDETWIIVNGKTQRVEEKKVEGPIVNGGIKEVVSVKLKESVKSKKIKHKKNKNDK